MLGVTTADAATLGNTRAQLPHACQLWGVLNVTPDSFSDGGRYLEPGPALAHARRMLACGADVVDVGGASSRPRGQLYGDGAAEVSVDEELARVLPVVSTLTRELNATVSIDTTRAEVADAALTAGAAIVNDVSCGASGALLDVVARHGAQYVLMHTRGCGEVDDHNTRYADLIADVLDELLAAVARSVARGVDKERIWLDPGLGFAKTASQSLGLLAATSSLVETGHRVLVGPSRKGFIAQAAPLPDGGTLAPDARDPGTAAAVTAAVLGGAHGVRVHEVAGMRQAMQVALALRDSGYSGVARQGGDDAAARVPARAAHGGTP